jgi:DtxR family Mn-dependent transcriptional regulator
VPDGKSTAALGEAAQDYLKTIYKLSLQEGRVTPAQVAERLGVSAAAVTRMVRRLTELNLLRYSRGEELALTTAGSKVALEIVRHHRLLELYLQEALGYGWDEVDAEAEKLEHVISEEFEDRIDALLGYPTRDPHGHPIPTREGDWPEGCDGTGGGSLSGMLPGETGTVRLVSDADPAMLRYMARVGLCPNAEVEMLEREPYGGPLRIRVQGREQAIGHELAAHVRVTPTAHQQEGEREDAA